MIYKGHRLLTSFLTIILPPTPQELQSLPPNPPELQSLPPTPQEFQRLP